MNHTQKVMKLFLKLMLKVIHTGNAFHSPDGDTTDVLTACCNLSLLHCRLITSYEALDNTVWSCRRIWGFVTSWSAAQTWLRRKKCSKRHSHKAECEGGRRKGERLWLLDLFLWLHHVVVKGSKGDNCFFFFFIHSLDGQKTSVRLPDNHRLKPETRNEGWGKVCGTLPV